MRSTRFTLPAGLAALASVASAFPFHIQASSSCAAVNGTFSIDNYKLYPENLDWDPVHCKLYISANFNASVLVYDPYTTSYDILTFDGITGVDPFHISGIDYDAASCSIVIQANSGEPFVSSGANMTGANYVIRYDTKTDSVAYQADMAAFTAQLALDGYTGGGYQDSAEDAAGNAYVPSVFHVPGFAKITPDGIVTPWYIGTPSNSTKYMYLGLVWHEATEKLIVTAPYLGTFLSFDTTSSTPAPKNVTMTGWPADGSYTADDLECDGLLNPARYGRKVLLCSENGLQAVTLWASADGTFDSVAYIGQVADNSTTDIATWASPTATVEVGGTIYISHEFFHDLNEFDVVGTRASFPFVDATAEFDAVVKAAGLEIVEA